MEQNDNPVTEQEYIEWFKNVKPREEMPERLYKYFQDTYSKRFPNTYHFISIPVVRNSDNAQ